MHATHCLVGCMLCLASIGAMAATASSESQEMGTAAAHVILDNSAHSSNTSGELPDGSSSGSNDQSGSSMDPGTPLSGGNDPDSPGTTQMHRGHAHHVGWQSLLPGSIQ